MNMISRRKIISRSQSELDYPHNIYEIDEDVWFSKDKLYQVSLVNFFYFYFSLCTLTQQQQQQLLSSSFYSSSTCSSNKTFSSFA